MATRKLSDIPAPVVSANPFIQAVTGSVKGAKTFEPRSGTDAFNMARSTNVMLFGSQGVGKTFQVIMLLLKGYKVYLLVTDYAGSGVDSIYNWFSDHPEHAHLLDNLRIIDFTRYESENGTSWKMFEQFIRNPGVADPEIYNFDPDILFWDGGSSFQQSDLEDYIGSMDPVRRDQGKNVTEQRDQGLILEQSDWGMVKNGTLKPLIRFLKLYNEQTGKRWSKVVTFLEDEKAKYVNNKKEEGSETVGPLLHGAAREIASAGFSIALRVTKSEIGPNKSYKFENSGSNVMIKDRGFNVPAYGKADLGELWESHIAPKIGTKKTATSERLDASNKQNA